MRTTRWTSALAAIGLTAMFGCAADETQLPPVGELSQGINILEADPAFGVLGAYRDGGDVVYFQTAVGYLKPEIYRESFPEEPAEEMDVRFLDKNGLTFYVQRGGDQFVDPSWNDSLAESFRTYVPDEDRARDFALAQAAGLAFPKVARPDLASHTFHLREHGQRLIPSQDPVMIARAVEIQNTPRPEQAHGYYSGSGWWYLEGDNHTKCVALCAGTHSAVALWGYDTSWKVLVNACNHGTCARSMSNVKCYSTGGWHYDPNHYFEHRTDTGIGGGCGTKYDWWGGSNTHLCNDDTAYQLRQIKEGKWNTSQGDYNTFVSGDYSCYVGKGKWSAPSCP